MEEPAESMDLPPCPSCGAGVRPDWDWCHACGFDPEGLRPAESPRPSPPVAAGVAPVIPLRAPPPTADGATADVAPPRGLPVAPAAPRGSRRRRRIVSGIVIVAVVAAGAFLGLRLLDGDGGEVASPPPTSAAPRPQDWVSYTAPDGSFTARFPGEPTAQQQIVPLDATTSFTMQMYLYESGDTGFGVLESTTLPEPGLDLSRVAAGMALGAGGRIGLEAPTELQGFPAVDASIDVDGGTMLVTAVRAGGRVVVVEYVAPQPDPLVWARFRSSLVITPA